MTESVDDPGGDAARPDLVLRPERHRRGQDDRDPAPERPQLREPDPHHPRGHRGGTPGANIDGAGSLAWRASASFSANGQRPRDNNYLLDGVDNNETWLQTVVIFPSVDALDEFKLQTSTYSAEFGRSMGGVVNLQIKSGSNRFHGSAFEFLRNDRFDANNWFNNRAGRAEAASSAAPVRRHAGRPHHQGQDVLLRRLPGHAHQPGPVPTCPRCPRS